MGKVYLGPYRAAVTEHRHALNSVRGHSVALRFVLFHYFNRLSSVVLVLSSFPENAGASLGDVTIQGKRQGEALLKQGDGCRKLMLSRYVNFDLSQFCLSIQCSVLR